MKLAIPMVLIGLGLVGLLVMGLVVGGVPELQVHQVLAGEYPDREVKVHGMILSIESEERPLRFTMHDREDRTSLLQVVADVSRPDTFQVTYDVAVLGHHDATAGVFRANKVFTKCPSKYEAEDEQAPYGDHAAPQAVGACPETAAQTAVETAAEAPAR
jgi:cytochrome c-type biogenesis protein CcmE